MSHIPTQDCEIEQLQKLQFFVTFIKKNQPKSTQLACDVL